MVTTVTDEGGAVLSEKYGEDISPAGTTTLAGTGTNCGSDDVRYTVTPAAGARPSRLTRLLATMVPPTADVEGTYIDKSTGVRTVRDDVLDTPPKLAVTVAVDVTATASTDAVNVVLVWPAGMMTIAGTETHGSELDRATAAPPAGAGPSIERRFAVVVLGPTTE